MTDLSCAKYIHDRLDKRSLMESVFLKIEVSYMRASNDMLKYHD